ncbi:MAG TPA: hypothetical protein VGC91_08045 [Pyrinomonadaceae bacterium]|jgi:hypothetical protein
MSLDVDEISNAEPPEITVGETLEWTKSLSDYPALTWSLSYYFRGAGKGFNTTAAAEGDDFHVTVDKSVTAEMSVGAYSWEAWVSDGSSEFMIARGETKVIQNLKTMAVTSTFDNRSQAKKILDAIDTLIAGRVPRDVQLYVIGNRQLQRIPVEQLIKLRETYSKLYAAELRRARVRKGKTLFKTIDVRFDRP